MARNRSIEEWLERYEDMSRKELVQLLAYKTAMIQHLLEHAEEA